MNMDKIKLELKKISMNMDEIKLELLNMETKLCENTQVNEEQKLDKDKFDKKEEDEKEKSTKICLICLEKLENTRIKLICKHSCCKNCLIEYVKSKIFNNEIIINCPHKNCNSQLSEWLIENLIFDNDDIMIAYNKLKNRGTHFCPKCNSRCRTTHNNRTYCKQCNHKFCSQCGSFSKECKKVCQNEHNIEEECGNLATAMHGDVQPCPRCRVYLWKEVGCNSVRCTKCKLKFCWNCLESEFAIRGMYHACEDSMGYLSISESDSSGENSD